MTRSVYVHPAMSILQMQHFCEAHRMFLDIYCRYGKRGHIHRVIVARPVPAPNVQATAQ